VQNNGYSACLLNTTIYFRWVSEKHKANYKGVADNIQGQFAKKILLTIIKTMPIHKFKNKCTVA